MFVGEDTGNPTQWFKFLNFDPAGRKFCKKELCGLMSKTIEVPEALSTDALDTVGKEMPREH